jgi:hypothetical protein
MDAGNAYHGFAETGFDAYSLYLNPDIARTARKCVPQPSSAAEFEILSPLEGGFQMSTELLFDPAGNVFVSTIGPKINLKRHQQLHKLRLYVLKQF